MFDDDEDLMGKILAAERMVKQTGLPHALSLLQDNPPVWHVGTINNAIKEGYRIIEEFYPHES